MESRAGVQAGRCAGYGTCIFTTSHAPSEKNKNKNKLRINKNKIKIKKMRAAGVQAGSCAGYGAGGALHVYLD